MSTRDEANLRLSEIIILRKVYGPVHGNNGMWKIGMYPEFEQIIDKAVRVIE